MHGPVHNENNEDICLLFKRSIACFCSFLNAISSEEMFLQRLLYHSRFIVISLTCLLYMYNHQLSPKMKGYFKLFIFWNAPVPNSVMYYEMFSSLTPAKLLQVLFPGLQCFSVVLAILPSVFETQLQTVPCQKSASGGQGLGRH